MTCPESHSVHQPCSFLPQENVVDLHLMHLMHLISNNAEQDEAAITLSIKVGNTGSIVFLLSAFLVHYVAHLEQILLTFLAHILLSLEGWKLMISSCLFSWLFSLQKQTLRGDLNAYQYLKSRGQEDGVRLLSVVPRGNRHKLQCRKLHINMRKNFFLVSVLQHWQRLPRKAVEAPSLETFRTCLDTVILGNLL